MLESLKAEVFRANLALVRHGLVLLTWGNASAIDAARRYVVIKPSGVPYETMQAADMVVTDLSGRVVEGTLRPSSDLPTHLVLYDAWPDVGGIVHTHATYATVFAQACQPIPCYGTTHADHVHGAVPCTRGLAPAETAEHYETNTGKAILEELAGRHPRHVPAVLVANHGPFTWGVSVDEAVHHAVALEQIARMALATRLLAPGVAPLPQHVLDKHFLRKHGSGAYYGQTPPTPGA